MYLKGSYRSVVIFLIINIVVFLFVNILLNLVSLAGNQSISEVLRDYLCMPAGLSNYLPRFWTIGTYMFLHVDLWHLLSNMLWLWFLGRIFCELLGSKRMVNVYLLGGISGGIVYLIVSWITGHTENTVLYGASGAVTAIVVGVATYSPDYRVFPFGIPMKLKWLALISFVLSSLIDLSANTGGKAAHVGGAIFGLLWAMNLKRGNLFSSLFRPKPKLNVVHKKRVSDFEFNQQKVSVRKRVDEILDKISRSGYDSLSREEKDFLQKNHDKF
jgi:membrane associated rhomboid family serine protease